MEGDTQQKVPYAGFWIRLVAFIVDTLLLLAIIIPLTAAIYGWDGLLSVERTAAPGAVDYLLNYGLPFVATILFWHFRQATPGKMLVGARIVDQDSLQPAPIGRLVLRNLGYIPSTLFLGVGFLWIAFDRRKQSWHDMMARTVVVRRPRG